MLEVSARREGQRVRIALALTLMPAQQEWLAAAPAIDAEAYDAYLKGLYHWYTLTPEDLDSAERYFELALAKDPNYARAEAGLALVSEGRVQMGFATPAVGQPKARAATQRALELDDGLAEAHYAPYLMAMRRRTLAVRSRKTHVLPTDVALLFAWAGDTDGCMAWLERAYELCDPNVPSLGLPDFELLRGDPRFVDLQRRTNLPVE